MIPLDIVLYGTIWLGLLLFVVGQLGQRTIATGGNMCACTSWLWFGGAMLCAIHMMVALGLRHGWSHQASVEATAAQTAAVYGLYWGEGIYFNYLFVAVWLAESAWWCINPKSFTSRPPVVVSIARAFYLLIIVNAAVVFAAPPRRLAGAVLVLGLLWAWRSGAARAGVVRARPT
jgi:hypothetical protein